MGGLGFRVITIGTLFRSPLISTRTVCLKPSEAKPKPQVSESSALKLESSIQGSRVVL